MAEKSRENRRIRRALPVVTAAVKDGNEDAIAALRTAAMDLALGLQEATGREMQRVHSALSRLTDVGEFLHTSDEVFFYPGATHAADGQGPPVTPGSVMSISETIGRTTSRIDAVPKDEDALARYGPQFTLSATDDENGRRAAALLEQALLQGQSVTIAEGLDVTFERLPPAFADMVGRPITGTVKFDAPTGSRRPRRIPDWDASMRASTQPEAAAFRIRLRKVAHLPEGWHDGLRGRFGGMTVTALWREHSSGGELRWNYRYERDSSSVREQLAALEFLEALSRGAELVVIDCGKTQRPEFRSSVPAAEFSPESQALLAFLRDVRTIETWVGIEFELPAELRGDEAHRVALIADLIRNGGRALTWRDAELRVPESSVQTLRAGDDLHVVQSASASILGRKVELGHVRKDVSAYDVISVEPIDGVQGSVNVRIQPKDQESAEVFERLQKPRRATRRPPPPPRSALRARRKAGGKRRKGR